MVPTPLLSNGRSDVLSLVVRKLNRSIDVLGAAESEPLRRLDPGIPVHVVTIWIAVNQGWSVNCKNTSLNAVI